MDVGLCVASQRRNKLDAELLSQCNTQLIMKMGNPVDQDSRDCDSQGNPKEQLGEKRQTQGVNGGRASGKVI